MRGRVHIVHAVERPLLLYSAIYERKIRHRWAKLRIGQRGMAKRESGTKAIIAGLAGTPRKNVVIQALYMINASVFQQRKLADRLCPISSDFPFAAASISEY
jgi:hypothetical protein